MSLGHFKPIFQLFDKEINHTKIPQPEMYMKIILINKESILKDSFYSWICQLKKLSKRRCQTAISITRIERYSEKVSVVYLMNQKLENILKRELGTNALLGVGCIVSWDQRIAERSSSCKLKADWKISCSHAVRSDTKAIHSKLSQWHTRKNSNY